MEFSKISELVHKNAVEHGWWQTTRPIPELLCLVHSEVSEALEAYRNGNNENFEEELADVIIRVMDMAEGYNNNLEKAVLTKHAFNINRPYRHGNKVC